MVINYQIRYQIARALSNQPWKGQMFSQEYQNCQRNTNQQDRWFLSNGIPKGPKTSNHMKLLFNFSVRIEENADLETTSGWEDLVNSSKWKNILFQPWQVFSHSNALQLIHTRYKWWVWKRLSRVQLLSKLRVLLWLIFPVIFNLMKSLPQGQ